MERRATALKKASPNGELMVYLRCRDFASPEEPIDGGVTVSPHYLQQRKLFGQLIVHFRFGREKDEVMGLKFYKDFVLASKQIYPPVEGEEKLTDIQNALKKKVMNSLNNQLYPFKFNFPTAAPTSVLLLSKQADVKTACGIRYYISVFVANSENDIKHKRNSVDVHIRRIQYAPEVGLGTAPQSLIRKSFIACCGNVELETTLDKLIYETNEKIPVNICIQNNSTRKVKKIKVMLIQKVSIQMLQKGQYKRIIDETTTSKVCPVNPGGSLQIILLVASKLTEKRMDEGIALDGRHKFVEADLASSTFLHSYPVKDAFGVVVNYFIRTTLYVGSLNTPVIADLPVVIMPERPIDDECVEV